MAATTGPYDIDTEARGPHSIGWVTLAGSDKPERSIILIGKTREEARRTELDLVDLQRPRSPQLQSRLRRRGGERSPIHQE